MALTPTVLISGITTGDSTSFTSSAAITPASERLLTVFIGAHSTHSAGLSAPSLTGNGMTWQAIATAKDASSQTVMTAFRAMGTPSSGSLSWSFADPSSAAMTCAYTVVEWFGASTSGSNGSGAVAQFSTNSVIVGGGSSVLTLTLSSAFSNSSNAAVAAVACRNSSQASFDGTWTALSNATIGSPTCMYTVIWKSGEDLSVSCTQAGNNIVQSGVIVELAKQTSPAATARLWWRGGQMMGAGAL
jgi:hypothetical protein